MMYNGDEANIKKDKNITSQIYLHENLHVDSNLVYFDNTSVVNIEKNKYNENKDLYNNEKNQKKDIDEVNNNNNNNNNNNKLNIFKANFKNDNKVDNVNIQNNKYVITNITNNEEYVDENVDRNDSLLQKNVNNKINTTSKSKSKSFKKTTKEKNKKKSKRKSDSVLKRESNKVEIEEVDDLTDKKFFLVNKSESIKSNDTIIISNDTKLEMKNKDFDENIVKEINNTINNTNINNINDILNKTKDIKTTENVLNRTFNNLNDNIYIIDNQENNINYTINNISNINGNNKYLNKHLILELYAGLIHHSNLYCPEVNSKNKKYRINNKNYLFIDFNKNCENVFIWKIIENSMNFKKEMSNIINIDFNKNNKIKENILSDNVETRSLSEHDNNIINLKENINVTNYQNNFNNVLNNNKNIMGTNNISINDNIDDNNNIQNNQNNIKINNSNVNKKNININNINQMNKRKNNLKLDNFYILRLTLNYTDSLIKNCIENIIRINDLIYNIYKKKYRSQLIKFAKIILVKLPIVKLSEVNEDKHFIGGLTAITIFLIFIFLSILTNNKKVNCDNYKYMDMEYMKRFNLIGNKTKVLNNALSNRSSIERIVFSNNPENICQNINDKNINTSNSIKCNNNSSIKDITKKIDENNETLLRLSNGFTKCAESLSLKI